eukprot:GHVQ01019008.1.p2 GENE.GHVQ01019008.1~~GHVQ01019008.1.p2  ORF type:complete len:160 (+),score=15.26 GHVQ01019008.1:982-1461(+)
MLQKRFSTTTCSSATNSIQQPPQRTKHHTKEDEERCPLDSEDCGLISRRYSSALCTVLAGGLAGMTSTCLTYPLDVWNTRMAVSQRASKYTQVDCLSGCSCMCRSQRGCLPDLPRCSSILIRVFREPYVAAVVRKRTSVFAVLCVRRCTEGCIVVCDCV